jgi:2-polyprenyl-3-methyl-5-hydroxy-6-metoxy-1,4-benzoquinol methylase
MTLGSASALHVCGICGATRNDLWKSRSLQRRLRPEDLQVTDHRYGVTLVLRKCRECGFIFADDADVIELTQLYERMDDPEYQTGQDTRLLQMRWLLRQALRSRPGARTLLDIGAGAGLLVAEARRAGLDAVGVEPSRAFVNAAAVNGVELLQGVFPHPALAGRTFDIITLVDVIEHIARPTELLRRCREALDTRGILLLVTPDVGSVAAKVLGRRWWHFRLAHVGYFDRRCLRRAFAISGLTSVRAFRARWFFRIRYLALRAAEYLPVGWLNRLSLRVRVLDSIYRQVIPLNLHDSWVYILKADSTS